MTPCGPLIDPSRPLIDTDPSVCTLLFAEFVLAKYLYLDFFRARKNELNFEATGTIIQFQPIQNRRSR